MENNYAFRLLNCFEEKVNFPLPLLSLPEVDVRLSHSRSIIALSVIVAVTTVVILVPRLLTVEIQWTVRR